MPRNNKRFIFTSDSNQLHCQKTVQSFLNSKFCADIGAGISYLFPSVAKTFEHVDCVGINFPKGIESIKHIMKDKTNGKFQILNSISFVSQDILKRMERFLTDLKEMPGDHKLHRANSNS